MASSSGGSSHLGRQIQQTFEQLVQDIGLIQLQSYMDSLIQAEYMTLEGYELIGSEKTQCGQARAFMKQLMYMDEEGQEVFLARLKELQPFLEKAVREAPGNDKPRPEGLQLERFLTTCLESELVEQKGCTLKVTDIHERLAEKAREIGITTEFTDSKIQQKVVQLFPRANLKGLSKSKKKRKSPIEFVNLRFRSLIAVQTHDKAVSLDETQQAHQDISKWSVEEVCSYLSTIDDIKDETIESFRKQEISGKVLKPDRQLLEEIDPNMTVGQRRLIMEALESLFELDTCSKQKSVPPQKSLEKIEQTCRSFDAPSDSLFKYKENRILSAPVSSSGNLLEPVHRYIPASDSTYLSQIFVEETTKFAAACMNERRNGTIHFGVGDRHSEKYVEGQVLGVVVDKIQLASSLEDGIRDGFSRDKISCAQRCIRTPQFVGIIPEGGITPKPRSHVVEVDIVPQSELCEGSVFDLRRKGSQHVYYLKHGVPVVLSKNEMQRFMESQRDFDKLRALNENKNTARDTKTSPSTSRQLQRKLVRLFCSGEESLTGDIYPVLVVTSKSDNMTKSWMKKNLSFIKHVPWRVVFDFGNGGEGSLFDFLEVDEEQVTRAVTSESFDPRAKENTVKPDQLKTRLEGLKTPDYIPWVFVNGYEGLGKQSLSLYQWKQERASGYKEAVRFFHTEIPECRATVVFLMLSQDYDILIEAADELCTRFQNQWFLVSDDEQMTKTMMSELLSRGIVESSKELEDRSVIGMPFSHINNTLQELLECVDDKECVIPASTGAIRLREKVRNDLVDLEVLASNQCDSCDITDEDEKLQESGQSMEEKYYMGEEVDWWNFWFDAHVLRRHCHQQLMEEVRAALNGGIPEDERVGQVILQHQAGAGGTTSARQVLWDIRKEFRCAVVKNFTNQTCDQIHRLHVYEDQQNPRPLLLLLDNYDDERVSSFKARLEEHCRLSSRRMDNPPSVFYVLLMCRRRGTITGQDPQIILKHELHPEELVWFQNKYVQLEKNFNEQQMEAKQDKKRKQIPPRLLISFNILKENFSPQYIQRTVQELTTDIQNPSERKLLKYVALMNTFDHTFQSLPAAGFDVIMSSILPERRLSPYGQHPRWENHISSALKVLLNETSRPGKKKKHGIRIINNLLSKIILEHLCDGQKTNKIMIEFLECGLFNSQNPDHAVRQLLEVVRGLMKKRVHKPDGLYVTKFSPMLQDIVDDEEQGVSDAADVLKVVFDLSDDVFVAQQLARLYIFAKNWKEAIKYAKIITNKKPDNSFLWDTFGNIFRAQVVEHYLERTNEEGLVTAEEAVPVIDLAFSGLDVFRREQMVSQKDMTVVNHAGFFGELDITVKLLDYLSYVDGLQDTAVLRRFLVDSRYVPEQMSCLGPQRIAKVKTLQHQVFKVMTHLDDEFLQLRDDISDSFRRNVQKVHNYKLIRLKEDIVHYLGEDGVDPPANLSEEETCRFRRRQILRLGGSTFRSIYDLVRSQQGRGKQDLHTIRKLVDCNLDSLYTDSFDLLTKMRVSMALSQEGHQISQPEMARISKILYERERANVENLEVFLFACMFNWPRQNSGLCFSMTSNMIPLLLREWKTAYYDKYPRQREGGCQAKKKETTMFFLANGEGMTAYAHQRELRVGHGRSDAVWRSSVGLQRLQRVKGTLLDGGVEVRTVFEDRGNKTTVAVIPTALPIQSRSMWNKHVYFVVGFTWSGPKAYDVDVENPERAKPVEMKRSDSYQFPRGGPYAGLESSSHVHFRAVREILQSKLRQIRTIRDKKARGARLNQVEWTLLCEEKILRQQLDSLINSHRQATDVLNQEVHFFYLT